MLRNHDVNVLAENKKRRGNVAAIAEKHGPQNQQQKIIKAEDSNEQLAADEPKAKRMCKRAVSSSTLTVKISFDPLNNFFFRIYRKPSALIRPKMRKLC